MADYILHRVVRGEPGAEIARYQSMWAAARAAKEIISGHTLIGDEWLHQVMMVGPGIPPRLYDRRWLARAYAYRVPCGNARCQNPEGPWMHPTTPSKQSTVCDYCWTPSAKMRKDLAARNRARRKSGASPPPPVKKPRNKDPDTEEGG